MIKNAPYQKLIEGNAEFCRRVHAGKSDLFAQLASGQQPHVTMVTCSDSRIDPCLITQTEPGDLFVIRNAGNIVSVARDVPNAELASLEFAVRGLGTEHIVICGHSDCGAMKGLLNPGACEHLSHVSSWVSEASAALDAIEGMDRGGGECLARLTEANVALQVANLRTLDFVREAEEEGKLKLHGWVFDIGSGRISEVKTGKVRGAIASAA
jgi:carbonic anhydrase